MDQPDPHVQEPAAGDTLVEERRAADSAGIDPETVESVLAQVVVVARQLRDALEDLGTILYRIEELTQEGRLPLQKARAAAEQLGNLQPLRAEVERLRAVSVAQTAP